MKICIIDDDWVCRFIVQKLLGKVLETPNILQFEDGQVAIDYIQEWRDNPGCLPELILLDINMPVANGWLFLDMLRKLNNDEYNPLIYISSSSQHPEDMAKVDTYPEVQGFLPKPLNVEALKTIIKDFNKSKSHSVAHGQNDTVWHNRFCA